MGHPSWSSSALRGSSPASRWIRACNRAVKRAGRRAPWNLGFSFGWALQHSCLQQWAGHDVAAGQGALLARARANSEASLGAYRAGSQPSNDASLFVAGYLY